MAQSLNRVTLIGRVGVAPTRAASSTPICNFTLATTESYKDKSTDEWKETTEWHNIVVFGPAADAAMERISKGDLIYVEGKLTTRSWTDDSGIKKYKTEIKADRIITTTSAQKSAPTATYGDVYSG